MLMHRTPSGVIDKPGRDAALVESTQALQPCHADSNRELLETDRALRVVDAVLLRGNVLVHARPSRRRRRLLLLPRGGVPWATVGAVCLDTQVDVFLTGGLPVLKLE